MYLLSLSREVWLDFKVNYGSGDYTDKSSFIFRILKTSEEVFIDRQIGLEPIRDRITI